MKSWLFAAALFFAPVAARSQKTFTTVKDTPEKALKAFNEGRFALQQGDVAGAIRYYRKAVEADATFVDAWIYLGGAHKDSAHWSDAETAFETALQLAPAYEMRVYPLLAGVEWEQDKFAEAAKHYKDYLDSGHGSERDRAETKRRYANAAFAMEAIKHPVPFLPELLGPGVNTAANEYFPVLTADGQTLIFTRRADDDENFYQSERLSTDKEDWGTATPLEGVNTTYNEGAQSISPDGSWLVFTACDRRGDGSQGSCDLYWSQKKAEGWTKPAPFSSTINGPGWDSQPTISADGKTIIFSSKREGALGNQDLWETNRLSGGKWSRPRNLGAEVNTTGSDCFPFLHPDGQTLYFTSDGHPGFGGDDIYLSRRKPDGSWGKPVNFGFPINTKGNEGNLVTSLDGRTAYFSAQREGGAGGVDIYRFDLPEGLRPRLVTYVRARVTDAATGYPLMARVELTDLGTSSSYITANTQKDGSFLMCLPAGKQYALNVSRKGYLFHSEHFEPDSTASFLEPYTLDIALQPLPDSTGTNPNSKPVVLKNVFFDTGSAALKPSSTTELDALAAMLTEAPTLNIQINGHTDDVGEDQANLQLSERRAVTVLEYLAGKGIERTRLRAKGFGETRPLAPNTTPESKALNRRTEFESWKN